MTQADAASPNWPEPAPHPPAGYLDAVGGQPVLPVAQRAFAAALDQAWPDPARLHHGGRRAGLLLDTARGAIAHFLGVRSADTYLGASSADLIRASITGIVASRVVAGAPARIVISEAESMAVVFAARSIVGAEVVTVPVTTTGAVDTELFAAAVAQGAAVACVQVANAEVGTRQPLEQVHQVCRGYGIPLISDATQVAGHDDIGNNWDALIASPRDWGAPSGCAALVVKPDIRWQPPQAPDRGWVGGFPDVAAAAAAGAAAEYVGPYWKAQARVHRKMIDHIRDALGELPGVRSVGDPHDRLPHILTVVIDDAIGEAIVTDLDARGIAVASGSACTADNKMLSHVLEAMAIITPASVRVSLPYGCTHETIDALVPALTNALTEARG
jgi:cysteine desulfurase